MAPPSTRDQAVTVGAAARVATPSAQVAPGRSAPQQRLGTQTGGSCVIFRCYSFRKLCLVLMVIRFICKKKCYDVWSCLLVGKSLSQKQRKLNRIYIISCKNAGCCTPNTILEQLYKSRTLQMATKILSDPTHFLHDHYDLPSGRRCRMPTVKTQRALKSFIPPSIKYLNQPQKPQVGLDDIFRCYILNKSHNYTTSNVVLTSMFRSPSVAFFRN